MLPEVEAKQYANLIADANHYHMHLKTLFDLLRSHLHKRILLMLFILFRLESFTNF